MSKKLNRITSRIACNAAKVASATVKSSQSASPRQVDLKHHFQFATVAQMLDFVKGPGLIFD